MQIQINNEEIPNKNSSKKLLKIALSVTVLFIILLSTFLIWNHFNKSKKETAKEAKTISTTGTKKMSFFAWQWMEAMRQGQTYTFSSESRSGGGTTIITHTDQYGRPLDTRGNPIDLYDHETGQPVYIDVNRVKPDGTAYTQSTPINGQPIPSSSNTATSPSNVYPSGAGGSDNNRPLPRGFTIKGDEDNTSNTASTAPTQNASPESNPQNVVRTGDPGQQGQENTDQGNVVSTQQLLSTRDFQEFSKPYIDRDGSLVVPQITGIGREDLADLPPGATINQNGDAVIPSGLYTVNPDGSLTINGDAGALGRKPLMEADQYSPNALIDENGRIQIPAGEWRETGTPVRFNSDDSANIVSNGSGDRSDGLTSGDRSETNSTQSDNIGNSNNSFYFNDPNNDSLRQSTIQANEEIIQMIRDDAQTQGEIKPEHEKYIAHLETENETLRRESEVYNKIDKLDQNSEEISNRLDQLDPNKPEHADEYDRLANQLNQNDHESDILQDDLRQSEFTRNIASREDSLAETHSEIEGYRQDLDSLPTDDPQRAEIQEQLAAWQDHADAIQNSMTDYEYAWNQDAIDRYDRMAQRFDSSDSEGAAAITEYNRNIEMLKERNNELSSIYGTGSGGDNLTGDTETSIAQQRLDPSSAQASLMADQQDVVSDIYPSGGTPVASNADNGDRASSMDNYSTNDYPNFWDDPNNWSSQGNPVQQLTPPVEPETNDINATLPQIPDNPYPAPETSETTLFEDIYNTLDDYFSSEELNDPGDNPSEKPKEQINSEEDDNNSDEDNEDQDNGDDTGEEDNN